VVPTQCEQIDTSVLNQSKHQSKQVYQIAPNVLVFGAQRSHHRHLELWNTEWFCSLCVCVLLDIYDLETYQIMLR
jgi:hypothetical protein